MSAPPRGPFTIGAVRWFMLGQGLSLLVAALIHFGVLMTGHEHRRAGTAETVIGVVLLAGLLGTRIRRRATRAIGLAAQGFALLGTLVGVFTIAIGVGPRTVADVVYHIVLVGVIVAGLVVTMRAPRETSEAPERSRIQGRQGETDSRGPR